MAFQGDSIFWVEVEKVVENPFQPRHEFDDSKLKELSESIRMYGILQPLTVTRKEIQNEDGSFQSEYELIAGERRLRASKLAGLEQVPVIIRSGEQTEQEKLELAIIENLQREDLNAVDRALAFRQLADVFGLSHAQVAKKVGRSREYVSNSIRLLGLPECMLNSLRLGDISEGHARTLLMLKDRPEEQDVVYREILLKKLSVREVERITRKIATDKVRKKKWTNTDVELIAIEKEFTDTLGTRVQISKTDFGGKLTIDYFSDDDLQKLLAIMKQQEEEKEQQEDETSTTVIRELSPEASLAAKLSQAVPLVFEEPQESTQEERLADVASPQPVAEDVSRHSIPQGENLPFGGSHSAEPVTPPVAPEAPRSDDAYKPVSQPEAAVEEKEPTSEVSDHTAAHVPANDPVVKPEPVVQNNDYAAPISAPEAVVSAQPAPEPVQTAPAAEIPNVQPQDVAAMQSEVGPVSAAAPEDLLSDEEFSFIATQDHKAAPIPEPVDAFPQTPTPESASASGESAIDEKKESPKEDEDLYSMKNFSL